MAEPTKQNSKQSTFEVSEYVTHKFANTCLAIPSASVPVVDLKPVKSARRITDFFKLQKLPNAGKQAQKKALADSNTAQGKFDAY